MSSSYEYVTDGYTTNEDLSDLDDGYTRTIIKSNRYPRSPYYQSPSQQKRPSCCKRFFKTLALLIVMALFGFCVLSFLSSIGVIDETTTVGKYFGKVEDSIIDSFKKINCHLQTPRTNSEYMKYHTKKFMDGNMDAKKEVLATFAEDLADNVNHIADKHVEPTVATMTTSIEENVEGNKFADCFCNVTRYFCMPVLALVGCAACLHTCVYYAFAIWLFKVAEKTL